MMLRLTLRMIVAMSTAMVTLALVLRAEVVPAWIPMLAYFALWGWLTPPVILMLHNTMHRRFIRTARIFDLLHAYLMSFFRHPLRLPRASRRDAPRRGQHVGGPLVDPALPAG